MARTCRRVTLCALLLFCCSLRVGWLLLRLLLLRLRVYLLGCRLLQVLVVAMTRWVPRMVLRLAFMFIRFKIIRLYWIEWYEATRAGHGGHVMSGHAVGIVCHV